MSENQGPNHGTVPWKVLQHLTSAEAGPTELSVALNCSVSAASTALKALCEQKLVDKLGDRGPYRTNDAGKTWLALPEEKVEKPRQPRAPKAKPTEPANLAPSVEPKAPVGTPSLSEELTYRRDRVGFFEKAIGELSAQLGVYKALLAAEQAAIDSLELSTENLQHEKAETKAAA